MVLTQEICNGILITETAEITLDHIIFLVSIMNFAAYYFHYL